jgi:hypothetical protein
MTDLDHDDDAEAVPSAEPTLVEEIFTTPDPILRAMIDAVNRHDAGISLTLHVSGVVVSGTLAAGNFVHLRDAQVFTSGDDRPLPKTLWRGRLSHVSAWSIGSYSQS